MVVSSRLRDGTGSLAGVEQREAAGAVGRFHHAGLETALPDGRGLLVAGDAADRGSRRRARSVRAEIAAQSRTSRQQRQRHAETVCSSSSSHARCGCRTAACARHWWRRSRAPCRRSAARSGSCRWCRRRARPLPPLARAPSTWSSSQAILVAEKYGSSSSPVRAAIVGFVAGLAQRRASIGGAAVLPDDGVVDRLAGGAIPDHAWSRADW